MSRHHWIPSRFGLLFEDTDTSNGKTMNLKVCGVLADCRGVLVEGCGVLVEG
ncbi:MAG: hypothetical protein RLN90_07365 [Balneolaceae bacterium]